MKNKYSGDFINSLKYLKTKQENYKFIYLQKTFSCLGKNGFSYMTEITKPSLERIIKKLMYEKDIT